MEASLAQQQQPHTPCTKQQQAAVEQISTAVAAAAAGAPSGAAAAAKAKARAHAIVKRSAQAPSEKSSDSSHLSTVSVGSKARSSFEVHSASKKMNTTRSLPLIKRQCTEAAKLTTCTNNASSKKKWGVSSTSPSKTGESEISSGVSGDVAQGLTSEAFDPSELASWPDSGVDFYLEGEVEDTNASLHKAAKEDSCPSKDTNQDTQSESVAAGADGPEVSEQQGTEGTSSSAKSGKTTSPGKRKVKVDWTPELHRRFVQAVEQLGVEKAIPSKILEIMGVKCLTRHNIASHLQKYRSHRRHLAAREAEAANWQQQRKAGDAPIWPGAVPGKPGPAPFTWGPFPGAPMPAAAPAGFPPGMAPAGPVPGRPVMGMPPPSMVQGMPHPMAPMAAPGGPMAMGQPQPAHMGPAMGMPMHVWGHPAVDHSQAHMWQRPGAYPMAPPAWYGPDGSVWHYPMPFQQAPSPMEMWPHPGGAPGYPGAGMVSGTPCFPPQLMPVPAPPQRIPSGVSTSGPSHMSYPAVPGLPLPGATPALLEAPPTPAAPSTPAASASASASVSISGFQGTKGGDGANTIAVQGGGLEDELPMGSMPEDAFLDEPLPECMFTVPDDVSLGLGSDGEEFCDFQPSSILDAAISEALANPATPLPLGLKPPVVDGVLEELNRQGITMLPPLKGSGMGPVDIKCHLDDDDLLGEVDDQSLMLGDDFVEDQLSDESLKALLNP